MERTSRLKSKILKYLLYKKIENTNGFKFHIGKRFSGPLIPTEHESFGAHEPTSPEVSCIGQIKRKNEVKHKQYELDHVKNTKRTSACDGATYNDLKKGLPDRAPSLSLMKRFASGRDPLVNSDRLTQVAPLDADHQIYYSDEDMETGDHEEEEEVVILFSAPILIVSGGGRVALQPRKEINLWKRRTIAPLTPLQIHTPLVKAL